MFTHYPEIEEVKLFGSRARGDSDDRSDIDLMIKAPGLAKEDWVEMVFQIDEEINTLLSFDLIWWEQTTESLRAQVQKEGKVLYIRSQEPTKPGKLGESASTIEGSFGGETSQ